MRRGARMAVAMAAVAFVIGRPAAGGGFLSWQDSNHHGGFSAGGGFDLAARLLARHIGDHIPGRPNVVVENMPGAASLTSVLYLNKGAPRDGSVIDTFNFSQITNSKLEPEKAPVDFRNFGWLGCISEDVTVCVAYAWRGYARRTAEAWSRSHGPHVSRLIERHQPAHSQI